MSTLTSVPAALVRAGNNDRTTFDDAYIASLAASIERDGLAQPPTLRPMGDGTYEIVAGECRTRAMRLLGWAEIPAFVRELTDDQAADTMLVENMVRRNLDPIAEAGAYRKRIDAGASVADMASLVGVSERLVRSRLELLTLGPDARSLVTSGQLSLTMAAQLVGLDGDRQNLALRALGAGDMTTAGFTAVCDRLRREQESQPMFDADAFWSVEEYVATADAADAERKLSAMCGQILGTADIERAVGIKAASVRRLVTRGTFPQPDGHLGVTPWWHAETVAEWQRTRRSGGRPSRQSA